MDLRIVNLVKAFDRFPALHGVSLDIRSGELLALLGPSGSGKTTLLRLIAGLEFPTSGEIWFGNENASALSVRARNIGFVFQSYALFRHMSVFENVAFGLRARRRRLRLKPGEIRARVERLLELVQLGALGERYPAQLSGGQRQRVALARALAIEPRILLLDEPFGALDAKVRKELRRWLHQLHEEIHVTSVFVTHDQEEALELADRVIVLDHGRVQQVGTPAEVYERPQSAFVANFVGVSNELDRDGKRYAVRPEKIHLSDAGSTPAPGLHAEPGRIRDVVYAGMVTRFFVELDRGGELQVVRQNLETSSAEAQDARGRQVLLEWRPEHQLEIEHVGDTEGDQ
jgi:sulfate ABC transporter ATP-binding protein